MNIVPVHCGSDTGFQVTAGALQAAYDEAVASGARVRGVVLTNPSNPLGTTIERAVLEDIVDFVARNDLHLISDEIYSGSVFAGPELVSVAEVVEGRVRRGDGRGVAARVHAVYSLSKDLGLPGFRVGVVYSYNDAVVAAARRMSSFTLVSSQTQRTLAAMLSDAAFAAAYSAPTGPGSGSGRTTWRPGSRAPASRACAATRGCSCGWTCGRCWRRRR